LVAENAWKLFLGIENNGGFISALDSGFVGEIISGPSSEEIKNNL
jgi:methylmalonyl-CoA mutase N-terminal domain/subunit